MEDAIYKENRQLRRQLDNLIRQARTNEKKQELFDSFGFEIIAATTPAQLRELLVVEFGCSRIRRGGTGSLKQSSRPLVVVGFRGLGRIRFSPAGHRR